MNANLNLNETEEPEPEIKMSLSNNSEPEIIKEVNLPTELNPEKLPSELNPIIKIEIINLCKTQGIQRISNLLSINVEIIQKWNSQYIELGENEFILKNRFKNSQVKRAQKLQILEEADKHGTEKISGKYGIQKKTMKSWGVRVERMGREKFLHQVKMNKAGVRRFCIEEKKDILDEVEQFGRLKTAIKYDIDENTLDTWEGRLSYFGDKALESNGSRIRNHLRFSQEMKKRIVDHSLEYGLVSAIQTFGATRSSIYMWKREINTKGIEKFLTPKPSGRGRIMHGNFLPGKRKLDDQGQEIIEYCNKENGSEVSPEGINNIGEETLYRYLRKRELFLEELKDFLPPLIFATFQKEVNLLLNNCIFCIKS